MQILPTTANINMDRAEAKPAVSVSGSSVFLHLTKGFNTIQKAMGNAISFAGNVEAITSTREIQSWRFGFIQLMQLVDYKAVYLGRTPGDGQVTVGVSTDFLVDSKAAIQPWTSVNNGQFVEVPFQQSGRITADFGDHPSSKCSQFITNLSTRANGFLYQFVDNRVVVTALVAEDPQGHREILAHLTWILTYEIEVVWRKDAPVVSKNSSRLVASQSKLGPPAGAAATTITRGLPPHYNAEVQTRVFKAVGGFAPGRRDEPFPSVKPLRSDFYEK